MNTFILIIPTRSSYYFKHDAIIKFNHHQILLPTAPISVQRPQKCEPKAPRTISRESFRRTGQVDKVLRLMCYHDIDNWEWNTHSVLCYVIVLLYVLQVQDVAEISYFEMKMCTNISAAVIGTVCFNGKCMEDITALDGLGFIKDWVILLYCISFFKKYYIRLFWKKK